MHRVDVPASRWRKSSFSEAGNCVEVANRDGLVLVRDTKFFAEASVLSFSPSTWREFIYAINNGQLSGRGLCRPA
jgi:hypothetical protein